MTGIPDALVKKALQAMFDEGANISPMWTIPMRAALEAIGLPALLERVEAAESEAERLRAILDDRLDTEVMVVRAAVAIGERLPMPKGVRLAELARAALGAALAPVDFGPRPTHEQQMEAFGEMG